MTDDNPHRFTGGGDESLPSVPAIGPRRTLADLRSIARGRRRLGLLLLVHGLSVLNMLAALALMPAPQVHPGDMTAPYGDWFVAAGACFFATLIGLFFLGSRLAPLVGGSFVMPLTIVLLFPGLNMLSAGALLSRSRRTLLSRNVRLGWLKDDFSEADAEPSFWRPSVL